LPFFDDGSANSSYIKVYMKSRIKKKSTILDYTFGTMIAEIGGYTGLLLGVSIVHITILFDKLKRTHWNY
jgi:hypothetical protein